MVSSKECNSNKYNPWQNFFNSSSKSSFRLQIKKFQTEISIAVRRSFNKRIKHNPYLWKHYLVFTAICLTREVHWKNSNSWLLIGNVPSTFLSLKSHWLNNSKTIYIYYTWAATWDGIVIAPTQAEQWKRHFRNLLCRWAKGISSFLSLQSHWSNIFEKTYT